MGEVATLYKLALFLCHTSQRWNSWKLNFGVEHAILRKEVTPRVKQVSARNCVTLLLLYYYYYYMYLEISQGLLYQVE